MHLQLVLHHLGLLGSGEVDVAPAVHGPDVRFFQAPRVVPEDNLVDEGELLVVFPGVEVVQLLDHFLHRCLQLQPRITKNHRRYF